MNFLFGLVILSVCCIQRGSCINNTHGTATEFNKNVSSVRQLPPSTYLIPDKQTLSTERELNYSMGIQQREINELRENQLKYQHEQQQLISQQQQLITQQQLQLNQQQGLITQQQQQITQQQQQITKQQQQITIQKSEIKVLQTLTTDLQHNQSMNHLKLHQLTVETSQIQQSIIELNNTGIQYKKDLSTVEERVNQSIAAHDIIIHDVVSKIEVNRNLQEEAATNNTLRFTQLQNMFHYVSVSLSEFRNEVELNFSISVSVQDFYKEIEILNASSSYWIRGLQGDVERWKMSVSNSMQKIQERIESINSSLNGELSRVAFTASPDTNLGKYFNKVIQFRKIITNVGHAYVSQTGMFTCPQHGMYVFTWTIMSDSRDHYCRADIILNGNSMLAVHSQEGDGSHGEVASNTIVLSLTVGDRVWIAGVNCPFDYGYPFTAFSGWKI